MTADTPWIQPQKISPTFEKFNCMKLNKTDEVWNNANSPLDCKTVGVFLKISKEIGKAWR